MPSLSKFVITLFGVAFTLAGIYVIFSNGVSLPTRQPPRQFHFSGLSLFLFGSSPLVAGLLALSIAGGLARLESKATHLAIGISISSLGLAFALAIKG